MSKGRGPLSGFTCSWGVLHFLLCTTCMKSRTREAPNSLCLCYRHDATFFFFIWCTASPRGMEALKGPGITGSSLAQLSNSREGWESSSAQSNAGFGRKLALLRGLCAQHLLFLQYLQSAFVVPKFRIHLESEIYLSTFMLTLSCRLLHLFLLLFLHSSSTIFIAFKMRKKSSKEKHIGCLLKKLQEIKAHDRKGFVSSSFCAFNLIQLYISAPFF